MDHLFSRTLLIAAIVFAGASAVAHADPITYSFTTLDVPGSAAGTTEVYASTIRGRSSASSGRLVSVFADSCIAAGASRHSASPVQTSRPATTSTTADRLSGPVALPPASSPMDFCRAGARSRRLMSLAPRKRASQESTIWDKWWEATSTPAAGATDSCPVTATSRRSTSLF